VCAKPWTGPHCGVLKYKATTPKGALNIYNSSDPRNTWNGPIAKSPTDGKYHIFDPIYHVGSLGGPTAILHGVADTVTGPWDWTSKPTIPTLGGENPAHVAFTDAKTGKMMHSLWIAGKIRMAESLDGPWTETMGYSGGNPAPIFHNGAWYMTSQGTTDVMTTPELKVGGKWTHFAKISHASVPKMDYHTEDPFMWIDANRNWHIIGHAYSNTQYTNCGSSIVSEHFFSTNGTDWHMLEPYVMPYTHTVQYDDGSSHTFTTMERPNMVVVDGVPHFLNVAVDLVTGDEGCANRTKHAHFGHTPCDNCKWDDHAGTSVIALDF